jgi:hypothetical protein
MHTKNSCNRFRSRARGSGARARWFMHARITEFWWICIGTLYHSAQVSGTVYSGSSAAFYTLGKKSAQARIFFPSGLVNHHPYISLWAIFAPECTRVPCRTCTAVHGRIRLYSCSC